MSDSLKSEIYILLVLLNNQTCGILEISNKFFDIFISKTKRLIVQNVSYWLRPTVTNYQFFVREFENTL